MQVFSLKFDPDCLYIFVHHDFILNKKIINHFLRINKLK